MNFSKKNIYYDYPLWHYGLLIHEYLSLWIECEQLLNLWFVKFSVSLDVKFYS